MSVTAFRDLERDTVRKPGRTLMLDPAVFADDWGDKPGEPVCVGLRLMSDGHKSQARAEAERFADEMHGQRDHNWLDAFNDALVRQVAALALCSPNNVKQASEVLPHAEDAIRFAVTSDGARQIFEELLRYEVETSPLYPEATDEDLAELSNRLDDMSLDNLPGHARSAVRRYLRFALDALREHDPDGPL